MKQRPRRIGIVTALGEDALALNRATIHERLSAPFLIEAELSAPDGNVDYSKVVGRQACIRLELGDPGTRFFHGYVSRLVQIGNQGGFARYRATMVPWLWLLTRTADCRVFQRKNAIQIAEDVFERSRFGADLRDIRLNETCPARRYCVQYRETDFNFVSRLLEAEGVYYWFEHHDNRHALVLADGIGASRPRSGYEALDYHEVETPGAEGREVITDWAVEQEVQSVSYTLKDFDFKKPGDALQGQHEIPRSHGMARFPVYDYPGEYFESTDATRYARLRLEELQAAHEIVSASTTAAGLAAGQVFELREHPREDQNRKYLVTEVSLTLDAGEFASGGTGQEFLNCRFRAIPSTTPYRPPRTTPKPVVQGIQTATVVGPAGEEIHTDEHGRVRLKFHWDREHPENDGESSCWVRVAQSSAGKGWGAVFTPRIGHEVIVEFLEGDPDRPLVTGSVYNGENTPPYALPGQKNVSTVKTDSTKGGGGFNEVKMDDTKGSELLYVQAEKDRTVLVKNDNTETVGHNERVSVGNDRKKDVAKNEATTIGDNRTEKVGKNETISIGANRTETVGKDETITISANRTESVAKNEDVTVSDDRSHTVGKNDTLSVGKQLTVTAGDQITLKTGSASIVMKKDGTIQIKGKDITIEGSGGVNVKASKNITMKGQKITQN